tara:strand:- start:2635 stop:3741 length:1107 start_codon:yes stop_codon:yes gene_type:complete
MLKINLFKRVSTAIKTIVSTFGIWTIPILILIFLYFTFLRLLIYVGVFLDSLLIKKIRNGTIKNSIVIVGNPRSGTTFLHRYLVKLGLGTGTELWQMIFPSALIQKFIRPIIPYIESISPTRFHSTDAHKTSLKSIETDDASMLFRFFDGFFIYGFIFAWSFVDLFDWVDPKKRDMSERDFNWFESLWIRVLYNSNKEKNIAKLFSISANLPAFQKRFPDTKILYMVRDPLSVIPSGLSLVTGVLDKSLGFWSLAEKKRSLYINRLYKALVTLLLRFHQDWISGKINKSNVEIIRFDSMMNDFEKLMDDILDFIGHDPDEKMIENIKEVAEKQRSFSSKHSYDLKKFGLSEDQIRKDCKDIYETFLND